MLARLDRREGQPREVAGSQRARSGPPALRPRQRHLDRQPHVRHRGLEHGRAVAEGHQRVHQRLGMQDRVEPLPRQLEQLVRLEDLEPLVEQQRRVHRDAPPHAPHRVGEHLLDGGAPPVGMAAQGTPRGGEREALHRARVAPAQALERRAVLAVHRHQLAAARERPAHQRAADHQRLLVRERQPRAALEGGERGLERRRAHHPVQHHRGAALRRQPRGGAGAHPDAGAGTGLLERGARARRVGGVLERQPGGAHAPRLGAQLLEPAAGGERRDPHPLARGRGHLEGLHADRAGRAQHRERPWPGGAHRAPNTTIFR